MADYQQLSIRARQLIRGREEVANHELQQYLQCTNDELNTIRVQLLSEGFVVDCGLTGLKITEGAQNDFQSDIFVSYSHVDASTAATIINKLHELHSTYSPFPLRLFFDTESIPLMHHWESRLLHTLQHAKVLINIVSPFYFQSEYCRKEWEYFCEARTRRTLPIENIVTLYISTAPEFEPPMSGDWPRELKKYQYLDIRDWRLKNLTEEQETFFFRFYNDLVNAIFRIERHQNIRIELPQNNQNFTGRKHFLEALHHTIILNSQALPVALFGLSGMGKTTIARQYAFVYRSYYTGGCYQAFVPETGGIKEAIIGLAHYLEVEASGSKALEEQFLLVLRKLEHREPTLIVFDDIRDIEPFRDAERKKYFPKNPNIHFLLTTQCSRVDLERSSVYPVEVQPFSEQESITLLSRFRVLTSPQELKAAKKIHTFTNGFPIAIEMIGSYVWNNISYVEYYQKLVKKKLPALNLAVLDGKRLAVHDAESFTALFTDLFNRLDCHEQMIVEIASHFSHDYIPEEWLFDLYSSLVELFSKKLNAVGKMRFIAMLNTDLNNRGLSAIDIESRVNNTIPLIEWLEADIELPRERFVKALRRLEGFQLLSKGLTANVYRMHNLMKLLIVSEMEKNSTSDATSRLVNDYVFAKCEVISQGEAAYQDEARGELLPLMAYFEYAVPQWADQCWGAVLAVAQHYLTVSGDMLLTKTVLELTNKYVKSPIGKRRLARLLKQIYHSTGDKEMYEALHPDAGVEFETLFPKEAQISSEIMELNLLMKEGKLDEAIEKGLHIIQEFEDLSSATIRAPLITVKNNLAICYARKNQMEACIRYSLECVQFSEEESPEGSFLLATRYNNLSAHYSLILDFEKAIEFAEKASRLFEKLNLSHTEESATNLKLLAGFNRDEQVSKEMTEKALGIMIDIYGEKSPKLSEFYNQLANCEYMLRNFPAAFQALKKGIDIITELHGNDHPDLLSHYLLKLQLLCEWHTSSTYQSMKENQVRQNGLQQSMKALAEASEETYYMSEIVRITKLNHLPENTIFFARLHTVLGNTQLLRGQIEDAIFSYSAVLNIIEGLRLTDSQPVEFNINKVRNTIISEFQRIYNQGDLMESFRFLLRSHQILSNTLRQDHSLTFNILDNLMLLQSHHLEILPAPAQETVKRYMAARNKLSEE